jgi:hypothetical protein
MSHDDGEMAHARVIDQPLKTSNKVTFDNVVYYGPARIDALLDQALKAGVPEAVVNEGKECVSSFYALPPAPGERRYWAWDYNPSVSELAKRLEEQRDEDRRRSRTFKDWFKTSFTSMRSLPGSKKFTVTLPIFVLGSPKVKKSKVSMLLTSQTKNKSGFDLEVFGSGLGADKTCTVTLGEEEVCSNGMGRRGNLEVPIIATPVGFNLSSGPKVIWWNCSKDDSAHGRLIIDDCDGDELVGLSSNQDGDDIDLTNSSVSSKITKSVEIGTGREYKLGIKKAHELNATINMCLKTSQDIKLAFELPGKHRYRPYAPTDGLGAIWRVV